MRVEKPVATAWAKMVSALLAAVFAVCAASAQYAWAAEYTVTDTVKNTPIHVDWYFTRSWAKDPSPQFTSNNSNVFERVANNKYSVAVKVPSGAQHVTVSNSNGSPVCTLRYADVGMTTNQRRIDMLIEILYVHVEHDHRVNKKTGNRDLPIVPPDGARADGCIAIFVKSAAELLASGASAGTKDEFGVVPSNGAWIKFNLKAVYHGTSTVVPGKGYLTFADLDQPEKIRHHPKDDSWEDWLLPSDTSSDGDGYTEGIKFVSGQHDVWTMQGTYLHKFTHGGKTVYRGTQTTGKGFVKMSSLGVSVDGASSYEWRAGRAGTTLYSETVLPGYLQMKKISSNSSTLVDPGYDLSGAEFAVKCQSSDYVDAGLTMGSFTSDATGACSVKNSEFTTNPDKSRMTLMPGTYTITETKAPAKGYKSKVGQVVATVTVTSGGTATATATNDPTASVSAGKKSTLPWSEGLSQYSLAGAVYGVYKDAGCSEQVGSLTTGSDGSTGDLELDEGTYYVKEISPSKGYGLSTAVTSVTMGAGTSSSLKLTEPPKEDPIEIDKHDADLGFMTGWVTTPQGSASLVGAEYTVCYYDGLYSTLDELPSPTRTWVMKTSANGVCKFIASNKVSGDAFYTNSSGKPTIPLGSITITETKAPPGYTVKDQFLEDPKTYLSQVVPLDTDSTHVKFVAQNYTGANVDSNGKIDTYNVVKRGDADMTKGDWDIREMINRYKEGYKENLGLPENTPEGNAVLNGAVFAIYNSNPNPVLSPVNKALIMPGGEVCRIKTDVDGYTATTRDDLNGWKRPGTWMGALAYGTYTLREISPPYGYHHNDDWVGTVTVNEDKEMFAVEEVVKGTPDRLYYH